MKTSKMKLFLLLILFCLSNITKAQTISWTLNDVQYNIDLRVIREDTINKIYETIVINNMSGKNIYIPTNRDMYILPAIDMLVQKIGVVYKDLKSIGVGSRYLSLTLLKAGEKISFDMSCIIEKTPKDVEMIIAADFIFADMIDQNGLNFIDNITVDGKVFPTNKEEKLFLFENYKPAATYFCQSIKLNLLADLLH